LPGRRFGLFWVITRTRLGMTIRAGASNREMVQAMGIDIQFLYRVVSPPASRWPRWPARSLRRFLRCTPAWATSADHLLRRRRHRRIGSIRGALLAAMLVGFVETFGTVFFRPRPACSSTC